MLTQENTAKAQRMRILSYLNTKPLDTLAARSELDVMHPAARVMELRKRGVGINTIWIERASDCGKIHRIACYVLDGVADTTPTDTGDGINSKETDKQEHSTEVER
ncbi:helix-turn-helix domain-containing protein [Nitrosomonas ureae]|uniref:Helix-turn-helix domain-containing protein n=1 Tax=Nitrosomonas ureae TaxID=44577 RepID=A0A1H9C9N5_9PROT|nr:helix-turn-helix domain-containing protein [Nitrosomonas ureae]SEP97854.1 Helix-turn-helix domain-containing protein [Nitrosomonas ureae]